MTSRKFTNLLNARLRVVIQREQLFHVYQRRSVRDRDARNESRAIRALDCVACALFGALAACVLVLTGVL